MDNHHLNQAEALLADLHRLVALSKEAAALEAARLAKEAADAEAKAKAKPRFRFW